MPKRLPGTEGLWFNPSTDQYLLGRWIAGPCIWVTGDLIAQIGMDKARSYVRDRLKRPPPSRLEELVQLVQESELQRPDTDQSNEEIEP